MTKASTPTALIRAEFEKNAQVQQIKKLQVLLEDKKRNITKALNSKSKDKGTLDDVAQQFEIYAIEYEQFNKAIGNLDEDSTQNFLHALKVLGSFKERTIKKLAEYSSDVPLEQPQNVEPQEAVKSKRISQRSSKSTKKSATQAEAIDITRDESTLSFETQDPSSNEFHDGLIQDIQQEKNKFKQKELAIKAILSLYGVQSDNYAKINQSLKYLLPLASPEHFVINDNKLFLVGNEQHRLYQAFGASSNYSTQGVEIDCMRFDWVGLDDLRTTFPKEKGLWSILKSLKPVDASDERFSLKLKIDACIEVLKELADRKLIKTGKLNQALMIFNYAGMAVKNERDAHQLYRLTNYFLQPNANDSTDTSHLKAWLQRKIINNSVKIIFPESLIQYWNKPSPSIVHEKEMINGWFEASKANKKSRPESPYKNKLIELGYQIKEFYDLDNQFIQSMDELRAIIHSRLTENEVEKNRLNLTQEEIQKLTHYIKKLEELIFVYGQLREKFPIPDKEMTVEAVISVLPEMINSPEYRDYLTMKEALVNIDDIKKINEKHEHFLNTRCVFNPNMNSSASPEIRFSAESYIKMEERSDPNFQTYAIKPSLFIPKMDIHITSLFDTIIKINKLAKDAHTKPPFTKEQVAHFNLASNVIKYFGSQANLRQVEDAAKTLAVKCLKDELKKQAKDEKRAAIKSMLQLYTQTALRGSHADLHLGFYLKTLLPKAFPERFLEEDGHLVITAGRNSHLILEALGQPITTSDVSIVIKALNVHKLEQLKEIYPQSRLLWCILKTFKPIDTHYTAVNKINACIELAYELSKMNLIPSEKLKYALDVLSFAYEEAKGYSVVLKEKGQAWLAENVVSIVLQEDGLQYQVKDSSYVTQTGDIKWAEIGLTVNEIDTLRQLQNEDTTLANQRLETYLPKILPILISRGHAYNKDKAMEKIQQAFKAVNAHNAVEEVEQDPILKDLQAWLKKELGLKTTVQIPAISTANREEPLPKTEKKATLPIYSFWSYLTEQFNQFIKTYFFTNHEEVINIAPPITEQKIATNTTKPTMPIENSSDFFILNSLQKRRSGQHPQPKVPPTQADEDEDLSIKHPTNK